MVPLDDHEIEGVTTFAPPPAPTYRYIIALKNEKLSIWIENRAAKRQWYKGDLAKSDYVTASNTIPDASPADYAKSLDCDLDDSSDVLRKFTPLKDSRFRLELTVKIRVLRSVWSAQYTFDLDPVSVERIDILEAKLRDQQDILESKLRDQEAGQILESKLRDQQEQLERLRHDLEGGQTLESKVRDQQKELERLRHDQEAGRAPIFLETAATQKTGAGRICWKEVASDDFAVISAEGVIRVHHSGVYTIAVVVNHQGMNSNFKIQLLKGTDCIRSVFCGYISGNLSSCSLGCTTRVEKDAKLTVTCDANLVEASYLSVMWVGK
ncbi:hypothetical protein BBJ28_00026357 [Nothophytophthora sp. Chile5]|nr:hypothetical protein BBJ28_00026357 [Nothophytophthora sp. Chile5]